MHSDSRFLVYHADALVNRLPIKASDVASLRMRGVLQLALLLRASGVHLSACHLGWL
jgi:hypothetical protein